MTEKVLLTYQPFARFSGADILDKCYRNLEKELKSYLDAKDLDKVLKCAIFGAKAHEGQFRKSGEPYFIHPIAVCQILARQRFDVPVLQAALLHDVLEDTPVTKAEMAREFGGEVTRMVDGVSKLDQLRKEGAHIMQAASFQKMFVATAEDPRVLIIKLADRLHNMQTLGAFRREKQKRIAQETLDVYASIAGRLGLFYFRTQLEDLAFSYLYPRRYQVLKKYYKAYFEANVKAQLTSIRTQLQPLLDEMGIKASIRKRGRHLWGLYQRMLRKKDKYQGDKGRKRGFRNACQAVLIRIITDNEDNCYRILGRVHRLYRPVEEKFKDYIAAPRSNGYRSLHTSALDNASGELLNFQIRTRDMHTLAEMGIISVWHQYRREQAITLEECNLQSERTMREWLSRLKEVQNIINDPLEFYDAIKSELGFTASSNMYVYSPQGDVYDLPPGATAVDFAYAIHSEIGNHCAAAEVNGRPYPIYSPLQKGQTVRIIKSDTPCAHPGWLQFIVSPTAKGGLRSYLRRMESEQARNLGEKLLTAALGRLGGQSLNQLLPELDAFAATEQLTSEELLIAIGRGTWQASLVATSILGNSMHITTHDDRHILEVRSANDSGISLAECCHPLPRENIIGQINRDEGICIHSEDCPFCQVAARDEIIPAVWAEDTQGLFDTVLKLTVGDRRGLLADITTAIAAAKIDVTDLDPGSNANDGRPRLMSFTVPVSDINQVKDLMKQLQTIDQVIEINRT